MRRENWAKATFLSFLLFSLAATATAQMLPAPALPLVRPSSKTIEILEKRIPELMKEGDVPAVSIGIVSDGKPFWSHTFGIRNTQTREPVADNTMFEAASLSKPVFAYAVMKLVDEGKLDLDTPLSKYLDKPFCNDKEVNLITARYALSHRTGFPNWRPRGGELHIHFTPGDHFSYSGEGFVYLGQVVERITGLPLESVMEKYVFTPLGMSSSSYLWKSEYEARTATGHNFDSVPQEKDRPKTVNPAASLQTTAQDYMKFISAVVNGTGLKPKTWHEMLKAQVAVDPECSNCVDRTPSPVKSKEIFWALGWGMEKTKAGTGIWHWGDNGSFRAFVVAYPEKRTGVVMFTNSENGLMIAEDVVKAAIGGEHPEFAWLKYGRYDSPDFVFPKSLQKMTADEAIARFRNVSSESGLPSEHAINEVGYRLIARNRLAEAIKVFQWNVQLNPKSGNVYDSLGEAYMKSGDKERAIQNYEKSLELDPKNTNAIEMLKKLKQ